MLRQKQPNFIANMQLHQIPRSSAARSVIEQILKLVKIAKYSELEYLVPERKVTF